VWYSCDSVMQTLAISIGSQWESKTEILTFPMLLVSETGLMDDGVVARPDKTMNKDNEKINNIMRFIFNYIDNFMLVCANII